MIDSTLLSATGDFVRAPLFVGRAAMLPCLNCATASYDHHQLARNSFLAPMKSKADPCSTSSNQLLTAENSAAAEDARNAATKSCRFDAPAKCWRALRRAKPAHDRPHRVVDHPLGRAVRHRTSETRIFPLFAGARRVTALSRIATASPDNMAATPPPPARNVPGASVRSLLPTSCRHKKAGPVRGLVLPLPVRER